MFIYINFYIFVFCYKTSKLIETALVLGALTANATEIDIEKLKNHGECLDMMFQITDDILDTVADKKKLGKKDSDIDNNKLTYPSVYRLDKSYKIVKNFKRYAGACG